MELTGENKSAQSFNPPALKYSTHVYHKTKPFSSEQTFGILDFRSLCPQNNVHNSNFALPMLDERVHVLKCPHPNADRRHHEQELQQCHARSVSSSGVMRQC